jgi:hypothetical protein
VTTSQHDDIIQDLIDLRGEISEKESKVRRAQVAVSMMKFSAIGVPVILVTMTIATVFLGAGFDPAPFWVIVGILAGAGVLTIIVFWIWSSENDDILAPRRLGLELDRLYDRQAFLFSGEQIGLQVRQYAFRGAMQRDISRTRGRGDRYRRVNNGFQSAIIVGSLATTTVTSLNGGEGLLKWLAVGLSFAVGLSAGFTGYFKYRERAFYLRQTADDLDQQLNAYELGLPPYKGGSEEERIANLVANMEAIRVAQQQREQQLDQPKAVKDAA